MQSDSQSEVPAARILDTLPPKSGWRRKYPWDEWADGRIRELVKGEHFHCSFLGFRSSCQMHAVRNGLVAAVRQISSTSVALQFTPQACGKPPEAP